MLEARGPARYFPTFSIVLEWPSLREVTIAVAICASIHCEWRGRTPFKTLNAMTSLHAKFQSLSDTALRRDRCRGIAQKPLETSPRMV